MVKLWKVTLTIKLFIEIGQWGLYQNLTRNITLSLLILLKSMFKKHGMFRNNLLYKLLYIQGINLLSKILQKLKRTRHSGKFCTVKNNAASKFRIFFSRIVPISVISRQELKS